MYTNLRILNRHLAKSAISEKEAIAIGTKIASESITNIRTVASLRKYIISFQRNTKNVILFTQSITRARKLYDKTIY